MESPWTLTKTAASIKISTATLRNWHRTGALPIFQSENLKFPLTDKQHNELHKQLQESGRLQNRAHRLQRLDSMEQQQFLINHSREELLFQGTKVLLEKNKLSKELKTACFTELDKWQGNSENDSEKKLLMQLMLKEPDDPLGRLVEEIHSSRNCIEEGRYFTPLHLVRTLFKENPKLTQKGIFFDPALGSGRFIMEYLRNGGDPRSCCGLEMDGLSLKAARMNFLLNSPSIPEEIPLYQGDSLRENHDKIPWKKIDMIATNPPWASLNSSRRRDYPQQNDWNSDLFGLFIHLAVRNLRNGGEFTYILPQSLLYQKKHLKLRNRLLEMGSLLNIQLWSDNFKLVQSSTMALAWQKEKNIKNVKIVTGEKNYNRCQLSLKHEKNWDITMEQADKELEKKIVSRAGSTLQDLSPQWMLGLVTGNNSKYVKEHVSEEPLIRGRDISNGQIKKSTSYLHGDHSAMQQMAPEFLYRAPCKLVYRFVSTYPVAALDRCGRLLLNSANALILENESEMEFLTALLNSPLYRWLYSKKNPGLKILRSHLQEMPFPRLSMESLKGIKPLLAPENGERFYHWLLDYFLITEEEKERIEAG